MSIISVKTFHQIPLSQVVLSGTVFPPPALSLHSLVTPPLLLSLLLVLLLSWVLSSVICMFYMLILLLLLTLNRFVNVCRLSVNLLQRFSFDKNVLYDCANLSEALNIFSNTHYFQKHLLPTTFLEDISSTTLGSSTHPCFEIGAKTRVKVSCLIIIYRLTDLHLGNGGHPKKTSAKTRFKHIILSKFTSFFCIFLASQHLIGS